MTQHLPGPSGQTTANRLILLALRVILVPVVATGLVATVLMALAPGAPASTSRTAGGVATETGAILHTVVRLGSCHAHGRYAYCSTSGTVSHPVSVHVHVTARRAQHVSGSWSTYCSNGARVRLEFSTFGGWASLAHPLRRTLAMPYRHPSSCQAVADAQLAHGGRIHVWLTARN